MSFRDRRHIVAQHLLWNPLGYWLLRCGKGVVRRFETILLNHSLHSPTNGEYWLLSQLPTSGTVTVFDVGFHTGDFSARVLEARPEASIVAFDPWRPARQACANRFPDDKRIRFESLALSNSEGFARFHDYGNMCNSLASRTDAGNQCEGYDVPVSTLATWCISNEVSRISLLKIDAEGFDLPVMQGAEALLRESRIDLIMFEYATGWIAARNFLGDAAAFFRPLPYTLHRLFNGFLAPYSYDLLDEAPGLRAGMFVATANDSPWASRITRREAP